VTPRMRVTKALTSGIVAMALVAVGTLGASWLGAERAWAAVDLHSELLSVTQLPAGWTVDRTVPPSDARGCGAVQPTFKASGSSAHADGEDQDGDKGLFQESLYAYPSATRASDAYNKIVAQLNGCLSYTTTSKTEVSVSELSFPSAGNDSAAFTLTTSASGTTLVADAVVVRKGSQVAGLFYADTTGVNISGAASFVRAATAAMP
jgi:hypothetical protein